MADKKEQLYICPDTKCSAYGSKETSHCRKHRWCQSCANPKLRKFKTCPDCIPSPSHSKPCCPEPNKNYNCPTCDYKVPQPSPSEKTQSYWDSKREQVNKLVEELQGKPNEFMLGHFEYPESILNAYREGDVSFGDAVQELQRWSYRFVEKNKPETAPQPSLEEPARKMLSKEVISIVLLTVLASEKEGKP